MATAKHPFLKWFLEDRLRKYEAQVMDGIKTSKGPFSYSIEKDIDSYNQHKISQELIPRSYEDARDKINQTIAVDNLFEKYEKKYRTDDIFELTEDIIHPLVDSSNSRLWSSCLKPFSNDIPFIHKACKYVENKMFFRPSVNTVAVHMWSHVYLGWTYFRSIYNSFVYKNVESTLQQTFQCPSFRQN